MSKLFDDLDTFLRERKVRRRNEGDWIEDSYDYGVWWYDDDRTPKRLTWIGAQGREEGAEPGELYFVRLDGPHVSRLPDAVMVSAGSETGRVEFLGVIPPVPEEEDQYDRRRRFADATVEQVLMDWPEHCGQRGGAQWVRDRIEQAISDGVASAP